MEQRVAEKGRAASGPQGAFRGSYDRFARGVEIMMVLFASSAGPFLLVSAVLALAVLSALVACYFLL